MEDATYTMELPVTHIQCDLRGRMTLGSLLRAAQQIATAHCDAVGLSSGRLLACGVAFLLAQVRVELSRDILYGEKLRLHTEPCAPHHAFFDRYTSFFDEKGQLAASMEARWVLIELQSRRVLRQFPVGVEFPFTLPAKTGQGIAALRAAELEEAGCAAALYSRVDSNGHLNNSYYGDILCDALPQGAWLRQAGLRGAVLVYRQELPFGQEMQLQRGPVEQGRRRGWYVCGQQGGKRCFEGNLFF